MAMLPVCARPTFQLYEPADQFTQTFIWTLRHWWTCQHNTFWFPAISKNVKWYQHNQVSTMVTDHGEICKFCYSNIFVQHTITTL